METRTRRFALLLFDGFSNLCLANAVEPLRAANMLARRPLYRWTHAGLDAGDIRSSSGLPVRPEPLRDQSGEFLFVMPSYGHARHDTGRTRGALRAAAPRFGTLVGLDTGSWLLASAGLLDGYRATAHWELLDTLSETFPDVCVTEARHVIDRDRASCGGATTTLDLMLELIERHHGGALALEVAALFMHGERPPRPEDRLHLPPDRLIRAAAAEMRRTIESPLSIDGLARRLGLSRRSLEAAFRSKAGQSPAALYRSIRLAAARRRLAFTTESIAQIALRSGYADATAFARAFRAEFGLSPRAARQRERGSGDAAASPDAPARGNPI